MLDDKLIIRYFVILPVFGKPTYEPMCRKGRIELFPSMESAARAGHARSDEYVIRDLLVGETWESLSWRDFLFFAKKPGTQIEPLLALEVPEQFLRLTCPTISSKRNIKVRK